MLARGDEPERRSFSSWRCAVAAPASLAVGAPALAALAPARRSDFYVPAPVRKLWQQSARAAAWLRAFSTWFAKTHHRNMQLIGGWLADVLPKGLYARALIIIIAPIVVLEGVVAFVFMERHWQAVTRRLSEATARDIAAVIDIYEEYPRRTSTASSSRWRATGSTCRCRCCRPAICRRRAPSRSSRCSTVRCRTRSAARCNGRSGSTPSASRGTSKSASSSRTPSCASSPRARRRTRPTRTSSCCG